jgi:hypothetical protein
VWTCKHSWTCRFRTKGRLREGGQGKPLPSFRTRPKTTRPNDPRSQSRDGGRGKEPPDAEGSGHSTGCGAIVSRMTDRRKAAALLDAFRLAVAKGWQPED